MDGLSSHLFLMSTIEQINSLAGNALHKCPYDRDIDIKNLTIDESKAFELFPEGIYKISLISHTRVSDVPWRFNLTMHVKSPLKESMG